MQTGDFDGDKYIKQFQYDLVLRERMVRQYSWAIPTPQAIKWVAGHAGRIVEIGAGRGYWAALLDKAGVCVAAYDNRVQDGRMLPNGYHDPHPMWQKGESLCDVLYFDVRRGGPPQVRNLPGHTLFLCWPPHSNPMAWTALQYYRGAQFIYAGPVSSACGTDAFWKDVETKWTEADECDIPTWPNQQDRLVLFERKA